MVSIFQLGQEKSTTADTLENAYSTCETIARNASSSFFRSFRHLPIHKRQAVNALYAFCRRVDDIVDGDWLPDRDLSFLSVQAKDRSIQLSTDKQSEPINADLDHLSKLTALLWFRTNLDLIENNQPVDEPIFIALADVIKKFPIELDHLRELIFGMEDDLYNNRYRTFDELYIYCYRVASVVGLMCIEIYGYDDPRAKKFAESWGIFMQLTNVLRDVGEDIQRNRVYLPLNELEANGITESELNGDVVLNTTWEPYVHHYAKRARTYLEEAKQLLPLLPRRTRYSPAAMIAFYDKILKQIERQQGDVFTKRVKLNKFQKLTLAAAVYLRHRFIPGWLNPVWTGLSKVGLLPDV